MTLRGPSEQPEHKVRGLQSQPLWELPMRSLTKNLVNFLKGESDYVQANKF